MAIIPATRNAAEAPRMPPISGPLNAPIPAKVANAADFGLIEKGAPLANTAAMQKALDYCKKNKPELYELIEQGKTSNLPGVDLEYEAPTHAKLVFHPDNNEKNLDVAQAMRREGWNVIFFHYRGAWGSEGEFSFQNAEADVQAVLHYIMDSNVAKKLAIDTHKISIVGHSMGGHMALAGILDNPNVSCAVSYDGANMGKGLLSDPAIIKMWSDYSDQLFMLNGWSGKKMLTEVSEHGEALDLVSRVDSINGRPVFIIAANSDVIPLATQITPLVSALKATKNSKISYLLIEDDHSFSSSRLQLISATASFLNTNCR